MKEHQVKLTKKQIELMKVGLQDIVSEREPIGSEPIDEDKAQDDEDLVFIDSVKSVRDAIEVLTAFGMNLDSGLTCWAGIIDPLGGFKVVDDSPEEQERFRRYIHETYDVPMDELSTE